MRAAHSFGCDFFVLDNNVLSSIRRQLLLSSHFDVDSPLLKTSHIVKTVLSIAREGRLTNPEDPTAALSSLMSRDAQIYADLASKESLQKQLDSEGENLEKLRQSPPPLPSESQTPRPLLLFVPTHCASSILRSKSSVELLSDESMNPASTTLLVLGSELDPSDLVPKPQPDPPQNEEGNAPNSPFSNPFGANPFNNNNNNNNNGPNQQPFFLGGYMNNNQNNFQQNGPFNMPPQNNPHSPPNTSGQNDPEGSKVRYAGAYACNTFLPC